MAKKVSLQKIAEEMNDVMAYGCNHDGELINPEEQIDLELTDKALKAEIIKRAEDDLAPADADAFSEEVWNWFMDNNLVPDGGDEDEDEADEPEDEAEDETEPEDEAADEPEDEPDDEVEDEPEPEPKPAKKPAKKPANEKTASKPKADTHEKAQEGGQKPRKNEKRPNTSEKGENAGDGQTGAKTQKERKNPEKAKTGDIRPMAKGGNENFAVELVKSKVPFDEFHEEFIDVYKKNGIADADYVLKRAKIYWQIAHKKLGLTVPKTGETGKTKRPKNDAKGKETQRPEREKNNKNDE